MNVYGNEKADEKAKLGSKLRTVHHEAITSLSFLKRKVQECCLDDWQKEWQNSKNKGKHYQQFDCTPKWKASKEKVQKRTWSSYIQLKIGHGFFKSYLKRLPNYESAECFCHRNTIQNPTHLVLECSEYRADRVEAFEGLDNDQKSMEYLFNTKIGREKLFKFLEKTKIASKKWLLQSS
jgi:hypothetical protein